MQINSVGPNWIPQWTPALTGVRGVAGPVAPTAPKVEPLETSPAQLEPKAALKSWLNQYVRNQNQLFERIKSDSSAEATMFRRGLMISGVVSLAGSLAE